MVIINSVYKLFKINGTYYKIILQPKEVKNRKIGFCMVKIPEYLWEKMADAFLGVLYYCEQGTGYKDLNINKPVQQRTL